MDCIVCGVTKSQTQISLSRLHILFAHSCSQQSPKILCISVVCHNIFISDFIDVGPLPFFLRLTKIYQFCSSFQKIDFQFHWPFLSFQIFLIWGPNHHPLAILLYSGPSVPPGPWYLILLCLLQPCCSVSSHVEGCFFQCHSSACHCLTCKAAPGPQCEGDS